MSSLMNHTTSNSDHEVNNDLDNFTFTTILTTTTTTAAASTTSDNEQQQQHLSSSGTASVPAVPLTSQLTQPINSSMNTDTNTATNHTKGIDIHMALEILSQRKSHTTTTVNGVETTSTSCPCCEGVGEGKEGLFDPNEYNGNKSMINQTTTTNESTQQQQQQQEHESIKNNSMNEISTSSQTTTTTTNSPTDPQSLIQQQQQQTQLENNNNETKQNEIENKLKTMSKKELIHCLLQTQEERVVTYKKYNRALLDLINTNQVNEYYSSICVDATAQFVVLSNTMNMIQLILQDTYEQTKEMVDLIQQLQKQEKNQLHLTAAYHLEQIRLYQHEQQQQTQKQRDNKDDDDLIYHLLQKGVSSLRVKIHHCVEEINETMEEIRYVYMEIEQEE